MACRAEELGADTVWLADEILSRAAESLDEISGGRFILGLGAGHGGGATSFGFDTDRAVPRYLEALEILVPLLRGDEPVTFAGEFHRATDAEVRPRGPRAGRVPLMMGGHSPKTMTAAARHADIWSAYATTSSLPQAFAPMTEQLDQICVSIDRDPASIGRSIGVFVEPVAQLRWRAQQRHRVIDKAPLGQIVGQADGLDPDAIAVIGFARVHEVLDLNHFFTHLRAAIVPGARDSND